MWEEWRCGNWLRLCVYLMLTAASERVYVVAQNRVISTVTPEERAGRTPNRITETSWNASPRFSPDCGRRFYSIRLIITLIYKVLIWLQEDRLFRCRFRILTRKIFFRYGPFPPSTLPLPFHRVQTGLNCFWVLFYWLSRPRCPVFIRFSSSF